MLLGNQTITGAGGGEEEHSKLFFISHRDGEEGKHYAAKERIGLLEDVDRHPKDIFST